MQAGESLSFISIPETLSVPEPQTDDEKETVRTAFAYMLRRLMKKHAAVFRLRDVDDGFATEGDFQVLYPDGSYIHLAAYAIANQNELQGMGLSVVEHGPEGHYLGGFLFEADEDGVTCGQHMAPENLEDMDDEEAKFHFDLIGMFAHKDAIFEDLKSHDDDIRRQAEENWQSVNEEFEFGRYEKELGFSVVFPTLEDIERLEQLIAMASPFTLPQIEQPEN